MRRTPVGRPVLVVILVTVVVYLGLGVFESRGGTLLPVPWLSGLVILGIGAVVLALGWSVRQFARGRRPGMDPILAARTVVLATASAYTGALLTGWYLAHVLVTLGDLAFAGRRAVAVSAGATACCAVGLLVVGLVVERWCEVRREDDDGQGTAEAPGNVA